MSKIQAKMERFTPAQALDVLENHNSPNNRPIFKQRCQRLADDMSARNWDFTGEPLIFNERQQLEEGQHRLRAIVLSGCAQEFLVVRGVSKEAYKYMGTGRKRSFADVLRRQNKTRVFARAATCRSLFAYEASDHSTLHSAAYVPTNAQLQKVDTRFGSRLDEAVHATDIVTRMLGGSHAAWATAYVIISAVPGTNGQRDEFFEGLAEGTGLSKGDPILTLRNSFIKRPPNTRGQGHDTQSLIFQMTMAAWNSYRINKPMAAAHYVKADTLLEPI